MAEDSLVGVTAELGVIGALLRYPNDPVVGLILETTAVEDFTIAACRSIRLAASKVDPDNFTVESVRAHLEQQGDLGDPVTPNGLVSTISNAPVPAAVPDLVAMLKSYSAARTIEVSSKQLTQSVAATRGNASELVSVVENGIESYQNALIGVGTDRVTNLSDPAFDLLNQDKDAPAKFVETGLEELDEVLGGGLGYGTLTTLAGRPGFGKSACALDFFRNATKNKIPSLLFSLEMGVEEVIARYMGSASRISQRAIRKGLYTDEEKETLLKMAEEFRDLPGYLDTRSEVTTQDIASTFARYNAEAKLRHGTGIKLVVIDYLQLLSAPDSFESRQAQISYLTRWLKIFSKREQVAVVILSQLKRGDSKRDVERRPTVQDLRESGSIEQDSDSVLLLAAAAESETGDPQGEMDLIVGKNRNGPVTDIPVTFMAQYPTFVSRVRNEPAEGEETTSDIAQW